MNCPKCNKEAYLDDYFDWYVCLDCKTCHDDDADTPNKIFVPDDEYWEGLEIISTGGK